MTARARRRHRLAQQRKAVGFSQEQLAERLEVDRSTIVRWESGGTEPQPWVRPKLAHALQVSIDRLSELLTDVWGTEAVQYTYPFAPRGIGSHDVTATYADRQGQAEIEDMNRRELLRLISMPGTLIAVSGVEAELDWERLNYFSNGLQRLDPATVHDYATLNSHLWRVFALSRTKSHTYPLVQEQLGVLISALQLSHGQAIHRDLCGLAADLFQLAGEIPFDGNNYTDAAHCYTLAATASREACAFDLWACALTRHAFIGVY